MDIVINAGIGGFSLSHVAFLRLRELGHSGALEEPDAGDTWPGSEEFPAHVRQNDEHFCWSIDRADPLLLQVVRELGDAANGRAATLAIVAVPDGIEWEIANHEDGSEHIAEKHRRWDTRGEF
jgi:hypothetical protein